MGSTPRETLDPEFEKLYALVWNERPKGNNRPSRKNESHMSKNIKPGVGLDIGTMNIVSARMSGDKIETKRVRDAFIDLELEAKKTLRLSKVNYVEKDENLIVLGDSALTIANLFKREARRPLSRGVISAGEIEAQEILSLLIHHVLGDPVVKGEHCYYSVPAAPIDDPDQDVIYHTEVFRKIVSEYGYTPHPMNEAMAIIYSQCAAEQFSGLAVSYGCLTPDTQIITRNGYVPISVVREGDYVLTRTGRYGRILKTWTKPHQGEVYKISLYDNPLGVTLTGNHRVWVQREGVWDWVPAERLKEGDTVGEPVVSVTGWDGKYLKEVIEDDTRQKRSAKVWEDGGFRCTRIRQIEVLPYDGLVHDITVEGDPSFCAPYITLHNSGMCNAALAYQTMKGLDFSLARGGDWVDRNSAKAMGSTSARMCSLKEKGVNLSAPKGRDEEAIALYIRALIRYTLENIAVQFRNARMTIDLPEPIPFVVSGGTTRAGGFLDVFKDEFQNTNKKGFPIPISEIRLATDPMTAVAEGLLLLASEE